jgi:NitT/TauT family transport system substrate-binding protein
MKIRPAGHIACIVVALSLFACKRGGGDAASGPPKVKVQLNWVPEPEFGGLYAARESGAYQRAGIAVEIVGGGPSSPVIQLVAAGQADFGVAAAEDVVVARTRGAPVVAIFATFQTSPQGIMVHASRGLKSLDDLRSGTLAAEPGAPFFAYLKKKHGFSGVTMVPYDGGVAKFLTDTNYAQQCYITSEPLAVKKKGSEAKVFLAADSGFNPYAAVLITRDALLRDRMALVRSFVTATAEGWRSYLADPAPANAVMGKLNSSMDAETFAAVAQAQKPLIENDETRANGLGTMSGKRWSELADQLVALGIVSVAPKAAECFTTTALTP